jgi:hypothetical protein
MASRFLRLGSQLASTILFASVSACGMFGGPVNPSSATQPPEFVPTGGQSKCKLSANQLRPLIVEWSAADRAALEVLAQRGTVVVRYSGCEMEILPRCRAPGAYRYAATTRKTEQVVIQDEDELYANLPTGAFKLEGKLKRAGQLNVSMNVVGQYDNDQASIGRHALEGNCDKATHVVTGLTVGAFEFSAGGASATGGGASALGAGVGASSSHSRETLSSDGDVAACESSSRDDTEPPSNCGALLRIAVAELSGPAAAPAAVANCPEGTQSIGGQCVAVGGLGTAGVAQANRLIVRVTCGLQMNNSVLGESDGLKVWIDGELTPAVEEVRAFNAVAPGAPGILQFVAYETTPGEHRVRIAADGCAPTENVLKVKPGFPRDVQGRLRRDAWYNRPPAGSVGIGLAASYNLYQFKDVSLEDDNYDKVSLSPDMMKGFGFELPISMVNYWVSIGFSWTKGDLPFEAPACSPTSTDCYPAGAKVDGSVNGYHVPFLMGGRLPFGHGAALLGSGFDFNILAVDTAEAEPNFGYTSSSLGIHVPVWAGLEFRPTCGLALSARATHGFSLGSDVGSYNAANASLALYSAIGCSDEDFGIQ